MRGKPTLARLAGKRFGITPADAGKTGIHDAAVLTREDHPRGCGENRTNSATIKMLIGSPPRMRGKQCNQLA